MTSTSTPARTYVVAGMTCQHCVTSVTEEVADVAGVDAVSVDLASGVVTVTGDSFTDADVQAAVGEAGYEVAP
ncbi:MAG: heavy-metal-associated protein [Solirubrobacterales bacterium]|nr:heavy-metal-associated protein [Solirubrobacterales bacterium]